MTLKKKIMQLIYIHRQLSKEWTGISIGNKSV